MGIAMVMSVMCHMRPGLVEQSWFFMLAFTAVNLDSVCCTVLNSEGRIPLPGECLQIWLVMVGRQGKNIHGAAGILGTRKWLPLVVGCPLGRQNMGMCLGNWRPGSYSAARMSASLLL